MTSSFSSKLLYTLDQRGFVYQASDAESLDKLAQETPIVGYIGFDCTAPSLHVGSLIQIMMLRYFQKCGHKPIILLGGGTTRIGDPSFKDKQRPLLDDDIIDYNKKELEKIFHQFLSFGDKKTDAVIVDNAQWLLSLNYVEFLREYGTFFSVNRMLTFESIKTRLDREQSLSFLEFNYMLLQAYDFFQLSEKYACILQMGGSDQWGNIVSGIELVRRKKNKKLYALTSPLLVTQSGVKMGKTEGAAVWLDKNLFSPYQYWQYWRNTGDEDVKKFLYLFTELTDYEINNLESLCGEDINKAKEILANEATKLLHGTRAMQDACNTSNAVFLHKESDDNLDTVIIKECDLCGKDELGIVDILVLSKLCHSKSNARKHIRNQAVRLNNALITDETKKISKPDLMTRTPKIKISLGKKKHKLITLESESI